MLFLLDEFAALGRLEPIERAMGLMAGYGMQLWPILQDMHQLKANYGERGGMFMSNAGVIQTFRVNDHATADMLWKTIGDTTIEYTTFGSSQSTSWAQPANGSTSSSGHVAARRLATPDEIMRMDADSLCCCDRDRTRSSSAKSATMPSVSSPASTIRRDCTHRPNRSVSFGVHPHPALSPLATPTVTHRRIGLAFSEACGRQAAFVTAIAGTH